MIGTADNTFTISASSIKVKQGETAVGTVSIKRGTNFDQDVQVMLNDLPKGVTHEPAKPTIAKSDAEAKFNVMASDEAVPGDFTIKLIGHPGSGGDATNDLKLTVARKDSFTLNMPFWTTGLKQGETKGFTIAISREPKFDQDVALKFEGLPKGVTVEPADHVIKNGQPEAKLNLKAADDAPLGDFAVKLIGHPSKGVDATHDFKFTISKK